MGSLDRYEWRAQAPLIALVVSRADFCVQRFELPNGGVFHLGKAREEQGVEFPSFDRRFTGERTALTVLMQTSPASLSQRYGADRVLAVTGEQVQAYSYGPDWIAEEHLYVPRPNAPHAQPRWVLGTALHRASGRTTLSVFEAAALADGPVAQLALPYGLPLGLHGQFVAV